MAVCLIPARGGSRRVPRKNIRDFMGKPMISYPIECAKASGLFDRVIVSTEDEEIALVAVACGAEWMKRPEELARDEIGTQEVIGRTVLGLGLGSREMVCAIYPCTPLLDPRDLRMAEVHLRTHCEYVMAVGENPLRDAGAFYMGWAVAFANFRPLIGTRTVMWAMPEERVCDINTPEDWSRAEQMYARLHGLEIT